MPMHRARFLSNFREFRFSFPRRGRPTGASAGGWCPCPFPNPAVNGDRNVFPALGRRWPFRVRSFVDFREKPTKDDSKDVLS